MAKVYSWSLGQGQYAYIANPNNLDTIYIGSEITVSSALQKVSNWAQTCTDEEYIEHFNEMIQEIEYQGLDIKFESVESYLNAPAVCDNLRGPAGRGISDISYLSADTISNASVYKYPFDASLASSINVSFDTPSPLANCDFTPICLAWRTSNAASG